MATGEVSWIKGHGILMYKTTFLPLTYGSEWYFTLVLEGKEGAQMSII